MKSLPKLRKRLEESLNDVEVGTVHCGKALLVLGALSFGSLAGASSALAAAGDLDPEFGDGGKVTTDFTGADGFDEATAMLTLRNGKTLAVGFVCAVADDPDVQSPINDTCDFALTRYNEDGSLDTTFGDGGKVVTDFGGTDDRAYGAARQGRKIVVVGGSVDPATGNRVFAIARYKKNGKLDTKFGNGGLVTTAFPLGTFAEAESVAVDDDEIVVAGTAGVGFDAVEGLIIGPDFALARYDEDGNLDASFGDGGLVTIEFSAESLDEGSSVLLRDDKIIVAGFTQPAGEDASEDFALARFNEDGSLDETFGDGGLVTTDFFEDFDVIEKIAFQGDKIVAAGITVNPSVLKPGTDEALTEEDFALARYNYDGSLDETFGDGGKVVTDFGRGGGYDLATAIAVKRGKIVVAGVSAVPGTDAEDFGIARYNYDGSLDDSFGVGGLVVTDFAEEDQQVSAVAIKEDRIIAAGATFNPDAGEDFALAAYQTGEAEDDEEHRAHHRHGDRVHDGDQDEEHHAHNRRGDRD
jgi:uncharacterized delta-60 repeat protein